MENPELQNSVGQAVKENYWRRIRETGRHVLALSIEDITEKLCRDRGCDPDVIRTLVLQKTLESPSPEDLKPETFDIIFDAMKHNERTYIWTVGDEGEYNDNERQITYPAYNFQRRKIEGSGLIQKLQEAMGNEPIHIGQELTLDVSAENKAAALKKILTALKDFDIQHVYIADDQQDNILSAEELREEFPNINIHVWWINNSSEQGNLAAFKRHFEEKRRTDPEGSRALILDWDNTIYDEDKRMSRMIENLNKALN